jgi:hypothetical protein
MRELDAESLTRQVHDAEEAIFLRWQEMEKSPSLGDARELEEIKAATNELLSIKTHKLNWPDPFQSRTCVSVGCSAFPRARNRSLPVASRETLRVVS